MGSENNLEITDKQRKMLVYACPHCQSLLVQDQMWVQINTHEIFDTSDSYRYCPACEEAGYEATCKYVDLIPLEETKEFRQRLEVNSEEQQKLLDRAMSQAIRGSVIPSGEFHDYFWQLRDTLSEFVDLLPGDEGMERAGSILGLDEVLFNSRLLLADIRHLDEPDRGEDDG